MGYLRLLLSLIVMVSHSTPPGKHYVLAKVAVLIFFVLAGYLATMQTQGQYKSRPMPYLLSRFIRLWPCYLIVFIAAIALAVFWNVDILIPWGWSFFAQLFMFNADPMAMTIGPAWMLYQMMIGYAAIALGIAATSTRAALWLITSLVVSQHQTFYLGIGDYYGSITAASLSFSVGAAAYWLGLKIPRDGRWAVVASGLSYPLFLCHYPIIKFIPIALGWPLFFAALPPTLALSSMLVVAVERPISNFRKTLRRPHG